MIRLGNEDVREEVVIRPGCRYCSIKPPGLSHFVIVDITNPRSAPLELQATVPEYMIPFVPIIEKGEEPFAMFTDLWIKHREWVLDPIRYPSVDRLIEVLDTEIVRPAQARFADLLVRKAEKLRVRDI